MRAPELDDIDAKLPWPDPATPLPVLRADDETILPAGTAMARIFSRGGQHPTHWNDFRRFGPTGSRFDHHLGESGKPALSADRSIIYLAIKDREDALTTCMAEFFQRAGVIDLAGNDPWFVVFRSARDLSCLDLHGLWPSRAGTSTALSSGPKNRSQAWSRAIHDAYRHLDGIAYPSSMAGHSRAFALYERAQDALPGSPELHRALADPDIRHAVSAAADRLGKILL